MIFYKNILFCAIALLTTSRAFSAITNIDSLSGTIVGTTTTYTVLSNNAITIDGNGIRTGEDNTITIKFTDPVDLTISPHLTNTSAVFSNQSPNNTFSGNAGSWSFTAGTQTAGYTGTSDPWYVITGSLLATNRITDGGGHGSGAPSADEDWGSFLISGVKTLTWTIPDGSNREAFKFSADVTVPEPSGSILLNFGLLLLIARRKR